MENNNLGRWTTPTTEKEKAFFARHSGAITRYGYSIIAIQAIWGVFSFKPALALVESGASNATWLLPFAPIIVVVILAVLHNTLRQESLEIFSNSMDKDELTINKWWNYIIPAIVIIGLFALDVLGVTATLRDDSIDGKKIANTTAADSAIASAKKDYEATLRSIATAKADDESAAVAPFASQLASAKAIRTYDAFDVAAKNRKIAAIENKRNLALAEVRKESATAIKDAESHYKAEKQRITGKADSTEKGLTALDVANLNNSSKKGWYVSTFFMLLFLLMNYKLVYLRVRSGIRINVQFTQLDATGSFFEKLMVVISNIGQRQGHRILVSLHKLGSWGTAKLTDFDGHVILEQSSYNGGQATTAPSVAVLPDINNDDLNNGGINNAPPPPPPLPPSSNGGGDNGGGQTPSVPSAPVPQNSIAQPQTATASAVATLSLRWNDLNQDEKLDALNYIRAGSSKPLTEYWEMCEKLNPIVERKFTNIDGKKVFCPLQFDEIYKAAANTTAEITLATMENEPYSTDKEAILGIHEASHFVVHAHYTHENKMTFHPTILRMGKAGGVYEYTRKGQEYTNQQTAAIAMAGFAGECMLANQDPTIYFKSEILANHKETSDYVKAKKCVGDYVELEFLNAYLILDDKQRFQARIAQELLNKGALTDKELMSWYNEMFPAPTPSIETNTQTVTTVDQKQPVETVKTVTTVENAVVTEKQSEFTYGDNLLKSLKADFQKELSNLKSGNGLKESIMRRIIQKNKDFDKAVREVKATPKLRGEICNWIADNVAPVISEYLKGNKEGSDE